MSTKHNLIIEYIKQLEVGTRISVRKIAQQMGVSEGTAYRAIKEAESLEYVKTLPRVGTVRIEKVEKRDIERLPMQKLCP
jgi:Predicted transcriptional regulator containing CBS domains